MHSISENDKDLLLEYFKNNEDQQINTMGMQKIPLIGSSLKIIELIQNIISNIIGIKKYVLLGDNFFKHSISYFPHCDANEPNAWLNILIPLEISSVGQKFIIFDQTWHGDATTWIGNLNTKNDFLNNKKSNQRPIDSPLLQNGTDKEIDDLIYEKIDNRFLSKDYLFGLSGQVVDWIPGNIIIFNSKKIHMTGKMVAPYKIGLTVRIGTL